MPIINPSSPSTWPQIFPPGPFSSFFACTLRIEACFPAAFLHRAYSTSSRLFPTFTENLAFFGSFCDIWPPSFVHDYSTRLRINFSTSTNRHTTNSAPRFWLMSITGLTCLHFHFSLSYFLFIMVLLVITHTLFSGSMITFLSCCFGIFSQTNK